MPTLPAQPPRRDSCIRALRSVGGVLVCAGALAGLGCAGPESTIGFHEKDPAARFRAIQQAAETKDAGAIPSLIQLLESDDPAERLLAIGALERITGQTRGYDHAAPLEERKAAAERWAAWYAGIEGTGGKGTGTPGHEVRNSGS